MDTVSAVVLSTPSMNVGLTKLKVDYKRSIQKLNFYGPEFDSRRLHHFKFWESNKMNRDELIKNLKEFPNLQIEFLVEMKIDNDYINLSTKDIKSFEHDLYEDVIIIRARDS